MGMCACRKQVSRLADLGVYPMHQYADAFAFDPYCHLRITPWFTHA